MEPLSELLRRIHNHQGQKPVVVFDLDSTLFCTGTRTLIIFDEFARDMPHVRLFVRKMNPLAMQWDKSIEMKNVGFDDEELYQQFEKYWQDRFFRNEYVVYDIPMPGAADYVWQVHNADALVIYLTGRDEPGMGKGTRESLAKYGFPTEDDGANLILKQNFDQSDEAFKQGAIDTIRAAGPVLGGFDNHPGLINILHRSFPDALMVHVDTIFPQDAPPLEPDIPQIDGFLPADRDKVKWLVVMTGLPATGKSTVASLLAANLGGDHLSTDRIREEKFGGENLDRDTKYSQEFKKVVYAELHRQALSSIAEKGCAVLDGTYLKNTRGELLALADQAGAQVLFVKTECNDDEIHTRLQRRKQHQDHFSEAGENVYFRMKESLDREDNNYLDIEKDRLFIENRIPLIAMDTGALKYRTAHCEPYRELCEILELTFPLYNR